MTHIKRETMDYLAALRANMGDDKLKVAETAKSGWLRRFLGGCRVNKNEGVALWLNRH
jgi:hypothetical protein